MKKYNMGVQMLKPPWLLRLEKSKKKTTFFSKKISSRKK